MSPETLPPVLRRLSRPALIAGLALLGLSALGLVFGGEAPLMRGYLLGFLFILGLTLGSMGLLFIHHLVGGAWGFVVQRPLEAATRTLPLLVVAFVPLLAHVALSDHPIYHWAEAGAADHDELLAHKAPYLNVPFFAVRAAIYFAVWGALIFVLNRWSRRLDETQDGRIANQLQRIGGPGIVLYMLTMTFAAFDWAMSLDPHWFSTIYGVIFIVGQVLSAMAFMILIVPGTRRFASLQGELTVDRLHDLAKLMFAFICLWAYVQLSQFLIIWYGNLPEEIVFYHLRTQGGYEVLAVALVLCQFVFPFLFLVSRWPKRSLLWAPRVAAWVLFVRAIDLYWYLMPHPEPGTHDAHLHLHFTHVTAPLGLAALWLFVFLHQLGRRPALPANDPRWKEKLAHGH